MKQVIVITSGKGGVGKTTCTANIGKSLAKKGVNTVLVEGDVGLNNLDSALHMEDKILYDLCEMAAGKAGLHQCLLPISDKLFLLPAVTNAPSLLTAEFYAKTVERLSDEFDCVLIDCPAGLEEGFHRAVVAAKEAIIVATPHITSIRDGYKTAKVLTSYGMKNVYLLLNRVRGKQVSKKECLSPEEIASSMHLPLCGVIPEDDELNSDDRSGTAASFSFDLVASFIRGEDRKIFDCTAPFHSWGSRWRRRQ